MFNHKTRYQARRQELINIAANATAPVTKLSRKTISETNAFYKTEEWLTCRQEFLLGKNLSCCICECDLSATDAPALNVDHIKPLKYYWHLRTEQSNLQILCEHCNRRKGNFVGPDAKSHVQAVADWEKDRQRWAAERAKTALDFERAIELNRIQWTKDYHKKPRGSDLHNYLRSRAGSWLREKQDSSIIKPTQ